MSDRADHPGSPEYALKAIPELIPDLCEGRAVLYLGAGVSQSAGLPSWKTLLEALIRAARGRLENQGTLSGEYFNELAKKARNLEIGDWLLRLLGTAFYEIIKKELIITKDGKAPKPSTIHHHLVRLPFCMAITTNYDSLLEDAYRASYKDPDKNLLQPLTWQQTPDFLRSVKQREYVVMHAHGVLGHKNSIILSGSQYSMLEHAKPNFGEVMKWLFKTRTFVFIGAGLEDPDLIYQLKEAISEHGKDAVGPHYALMPYHEVPLLRKQVLKDSLGIEVIEIGSPEARKLEGEAWLTLSMSRFLRDLSGRAASQRFEFAMNGFPTSDDPYFCLRVSLRLLLKKAIELTGSYRGDFCLSLDGLGSHLSGEIVYWISEGPTSLGVEGHKVKPNSICGIAFYQSTIEHGVYVEDVPRKKIAEDCNLNRYGKVAYVPGDNHVNSELAIPVEVGRFRMGVLNLESTITEAYSQDHLGVAKRFAEKAARLYAAAHERNQRGKRLSPKRMKDQYSAMRTICEQLWQIARETNDEVNLALLVYQADYFEGNLIAQDPEGTILPSLGLAKAPCFSFHDQKSKDAALVTRVFHDGHPYQYPDVDEAIRANRVTNQYNSQLGIKGPVIGFPVIVQGHIAGIVVAWHDKGARPDLDGRDIELLRRASHLMANDYLLRREAQSSGEAHSIKKVQRILSCITRPNNGRSFDEGGSSLHHVGRYYAEAVGSCLMNFLELLHEQEDQFIAEMGNLHPDHPKPTLWVSPVRCRCWIRAKSSTEGRARPQFLLALQVSIDPLDPWKSVFNWNGLSRGVAMEPHVRQEINGGYESLAGADGQLNRMLDATSTLEFNGQPWAVEAQMFTDNPHLSFLLSRVSDYPFAFQQRPNYVGKDIMANVLEKNTSLPWYVAPLIVARSDQWKELHKNGEISSPKDSLMSERDLAAFLTFDNARYPGNSLPVPNGENKQSVQSTEQWAAFQNDLLHQISLFGACLAQKDCFRMLL